MTITLADLKWKKSERLTDNDDGGGRMTGTAIADGIIGNLFPNISRVDRAGGTVNLRKGFPHVATNNTDVASGTGAIIVAPPADPNVSIVMFSTGSDFDERADARNYVENYVVKGPVSPYRLYDTQQPGQRMLLMFATTTTASPEVGEVYCLSVEASGFPAHEFYVRLEEISYVDTVFEYGQNDTKTWRIYTLRINKPLDQAYPGEDPQALKNPLLSAARTKLRRTQVAAASSYFGIAKLAESAVPGDNVITVDSIYNRLVPASTDPQGLLNQLPGGTIAVQIASGPALTVTINTGSQSSNPKPIYVGSGILPGSLIVTSSTESLTYTDAASALVCDTPTGRCIGSEVSYADGAITLNGNAYGGNYTIKFEPAATVLQSPRSLLQTIELETQRYVYTFSLRPYPAPGSVVISYRALGKWYVVRDDGAGHLVPDIPSTGSGLIDYQSGNVNVTFSALPDVGSAVLVNWGEREIYEIMAGDITVDAPMIVFEAPIDEETGKRQAIAPGGVSISWTNGSSKTASDGELGAIVGDAVGVVHYADGIIKFRPTSLPVSGTIYTITLTSGPAVENEEVVTPGSVSATASGTFPAGVRPGTVQLRLKCGALDPLTGGNYFDIADGQFLAFVEDMGANGNLYYYGDNVGSIDYDTGAWSVSFAGMTHYYAIRDASGGTTHADLAYGVLGDDVTSTVRHASASATFAENEYELVQGALELDMLKNSPVYRNPVPRGIRFILNGATYFDRGDGRLYRDLDPLTGAAVDSGSINYQGGVCQIAEYAAGTTSLTMQAMLVAQGLQTGSDIAFRTPGAPVAVGSLQLNATELDGDAITATADNAGVISADELDGHINVDTGVVELRFGHLDGEDWVPTPVDLSSIRYNTVIQRYVPLAVDRLKLDPTRLPVDGRVPIFAPSQIVVIHNTETETIDDDLEAGQLVQLSRAPISKLVLRDQTGTLIPDNRYSLDRTLAQITFADPLDLSGYQQPLVASTRVELMRELTEVQINGLLKLASPLTANFAASQTYVSTLLEFGNLQARVEHMFTQAVWGNAWADERSGADSVGKYNDVSYPAIVNNLHTITERWAVVFTGTTTFQLLGEFSGVVATGNTGTDLSPLNPFTGMPMFTLQHEGWGVGGFVNNNVLRFNTVGAAVPVWLLRAIALGESDVAQDQGAVEFRTDVD